MLLTGLLVLIVLLLVGGAVRGWQSQTQPELGLLDGQLRTCPDKPNCVSSQAGADDDVYAIAPIGGTDWQALRQGVAAAGGYIVQDDGHYLHATFTSSLFHFVDDLEALRSDAEGVIHIRSASRVGYSDLGVNRKRVEAIRAKL